MRCGRYRYSKMVNGRLQEFKVAGSFRTGCGERVNSQETIITDTLPDTRTRSTLLEPTSLILLCSFAYSRPSFLHFRA